MHEIDDDSAETSATALARAQTRAVYERNAQAWDSQRSRLGHERVWLDRLSARLLASGQAGGDVLDLGCGSGGPVASYFLERGFSYVGVDYAEPMLELARAAHPSARFERQDMRALRLDQAFDAVVSWDGSFHLTADEQRALLGTLAELIEPGGALLLTVGPRAGETIGHVGGEAVYHASLEPQDYQDRLVELGFSDIVFVPEDPACALHSVVLATRD